VNEATLVHGAGAGPIVVGLSTIAPEGELDGLGDGLGVPDGLGDGCGVLDGLGDGCGVLDGLDDGVGLLDGVDDGVLDGTGLDEPDNVGVGDGPDMTPALPPGPLQLAMANASTAVADSTRYLKLKRIPSPLSVNVMQPSELEPNRKLGARVWG